MKKIALKTGQYDSFGKWLCENVIRKGVTCKQVAKDLQISQSVIYKHINGQWPPTFAHTVGYCWYFNQFNNVEKVWEMVEERRYGL